MQSHPLSQPFPKKEPLLQPPHKSKRIMIHMHELQPPLQSQPPHPPQFVAAKSLILKSSKDYLQ